MSKRSRSPDHGPIAPKKARAHTLPHAPTLDSWLRPNEERPLVASSPHLHASTSTFVSFSIAFVPPSHVRNTATLTKEARRVVRELDVVRLIGEELIARSEGAFADGNGRAPSNSKGKERAREPDHRMWAVRTLGLAEGKDGTGGEGDYQLLEAFDDDGEKYGGERVLRVLSEQGGVDVLTICCRWFGGDMLGPARFHHMGITAQHSLTELQRLVSLRDLRAELVRLDGEIAGMRAKLAAGPDASATNASAIEGSADTTETSKTTAGGINSSGATGHAPPYTDIEDISRLERLVRARTKTLANLESRVGCAAMEQPRASPCVA